ncbi:MAG TPA: KH domain-containing protein [Candidatus Saccharimonadales bacterium]|nr:KH domain-containing protein [Candidatus Saccharimonadales bacterium]
MAVSDSQKLAKKLAVELIKKIGLSAEVDAQEKDGVVELSIKGENLGALIGYHGQTLESLQLLLSLMVNRENKEEWTRVLVDIGSYKAEREEKLGEMLKRAIESIEQSSRSEESLPPMSASERRSVHVILGENYPDYQSESEGEEPNRRIKIFKK